MVVPRTVKQSSYIFGETNAGSCFKSPPVSLCAGVTWKSCHMGSVSRRLSDWHWILQAAIDFRQIIYTSHAEISYTNSRQLPKQ